MPLKSSGNVQNKEQRGVTGLSGHPSLLVDALFAIEASMLALSQQAPLLSRFLRQCQFHSFVYIHDTARF